MAQERTAQTAGTHTPDATATAAVWSGRALTVEQLALPRLSPGEVLVRTELATICGSDLHTINGDRQTPVPTILGHEAIGEVIALEGEPRCTDGTPVGLGDRITWTIGTSCGECPRCSAGLSQKCESVRKYGHEAMDDRWRLSGGFASHIHLLPGTGLVRVPPDMEAALAAPANCATATVAGAARRIALEARDTVVVMGCGMLGLTAIAYARHRGCSTVIASDVDPRRLRLAGEFGATATATPAELGAAVAREHGADAVFELSGSHRAVQAALDLTAIGGRIALVGSVSPGPAVQVEPSSIVKSLTSIVGCHNYRADDLEDAIGFLQRSAVRDRLAQLVSEPWPLAEIEAAIAAANTGTHPRVAVAPH
ncbi:zinc-binding dehydrogenase [Brevibacterium sp. BRM-1]|uniref:zinc-binding dehydrogenase n=1 Tax=Brevibacterium sp. BRM-1 TaxID=2999062 RepID=UPI002282062B|nr:zinc-binding dehydrogenase [Brevibacterium sp. BRM-1]WAL39705.1 zinc-binding dehydrogenase [Brevibacterium sp. BRM-1]